MRDRRTRRPLAGFVCRRSRCRPGIRASRRCLCAARICPDPACGPPDCTATMETNQNRWTLVSLTGARTKEHAMMRFRGNTIRTLAGAGLLLAAYVIASIVNTLDLALVPAI